MEHLFGWTSNLTPAIVDTKNPESTRTTLSPPPFLSVHKTGRGRRVQSPVPLTPLESQLKELVVSLYSDSYISSETRYPGNPQDPQKQLRVNSSAKVRPSGTTGTEGTYVESTQTSRKPYSMSALSEFDRLGLELDQGQVVKDTNGVVAEGESRRRSEVSETGSEDSTFEPKFVREALELSITSERGGEGRGKKKGASLPSTPLTMSGSQSKPTASSNSGHTALFSSFSVPTFFSADDKAVEATDPQFPSISALESLPYVPVDADTIDGDASNHGQPTRSHSNTSTFGPNLPLALRRPVQFPVQQFPVPTAKDADTSFTWQPLYSHSDSGRPRHSSGDSGGSKRDSKPHSQVVESFQIEPELLMQQRTTPTLTPASSLPPPSPQPVVETTSGVSDTDSFSEGRSNPTKPPPLLQQPQKPHESKEKPPQSDKAFLPVVSVSKSEEEVPEHGPSSTEEEEEVPSAPIESDRDQQLPVLSRSQSPSSELDDLETASVLSIQQLTESFHNEPHDILALSEDFPLKGTSPLPGGVRVRSPNDRDRTPTPSGSGNTPTKGYTLPPSIPKPSSITPSKYARVEQQPRLLEPPASPSLPRHLQPLPSPKYPHKNPPRIASPFKKQSSLSSELSQSSQSSEVPIANQEKYSAMLDSLPSSKHKGQEKLLEGQLSEALRSKSHLEGQLESVVEECKATLKERAALQSKLAKVEAEMAEVTAREKSQVGSKAAKDKSKEAEQLKAKMDKVEAALGKEQKAASALKSELAKERQHARRAQNELAEAQRGLNAQKAVIADLKEKSNSLQAETDRKTEENQELGCKLSSLQASYEALDGNKSWLHDQLQDSLESKMKLQEDLRHSKATAIAQSIKMDQLLREREAFQKRVGELQQGVLEDKARLVSELETIEADVLSREGAFTQLVSDKAQLEDMVKMKEEESGKLTSRLAEAQVAKQELESELDEFRESHDDLSFRAESLQQENSTLRKKLRALEQELDGKSSDVVELEKLKGTLQERLRQSEAALISKEGTLQGSNDAKEILKQELEMVKHGRDTTERELEEARREVGELENQLKMAVDKGNEKEAKIRSLAQAQQVDSAEKQSLQSQLEDRVADLVEKQEELSSLEQQSRDLMTHFKSLQDKFQAIATERGDTHDSLSEKDRVIAHLADEKERADEDLANLRGLQEVMEKKCQQLQQEKAHLQGELEALSGSSVEDLQKALQDKASLQTELNSLRVGHQNEMMKAQAKVDRMESELKAARRQVGKTEKQLQKALEAKEEELRNLQETHSKAETSLREANQKLKGATKDKATAENALKASKDKVANLQSRNQLLTKHAEDLAEQLQHESSQRTEVERASGMVATKLKQNAEVTEKKLQEQNRELSLEVERLRGRLAGISTTQSAIREHAGSLEVALAERESSLIKLSAQAQKVLQEREMEDEAFMEEIGNLKEQLGALRSEVEDSRTEAATEKERADDLEEELGQITRRSGQVEAGDVPALQEELGHLSKAKAELQQEVGRLKTQFILAKTSAESAQRDLANKTAQVEILKREVQMAQERGEEAAEEITQLQEHLRLVEEKHALEMEGLREVAGRQRESSAVDVTGGYRPGAFDTSLSTIGLEETDRPSGIP